MNYIEFNKSKEQRDLDVKDYSHLLAKAPIHQSAQELEKLYEFGNSICQIKQLFVFLKESGLNFLWSAMGLGNQV